MQIMQAHIRGGGRGTVSRYLAILFVSLVVLPVRAAHLVTQTFDLQPGWNAVYLEVAPETNTTVSVFGGLPLGSAWTWVNQGEPTEFFQDLTEQMHTDPHWLVFFPTNRYESMFNDLYRVHANKPYFLRIEGTSNVAWQVTGRPAVPRAAWAPNTYNLVGFGLDPAAAQPAFDVFFGVSSVLSNRPVYQLNAAGSWTLVADPTGASPAAGACLWAYADGDTDFLGLLDVSVAQGDGLDYGGTLTEQTVRIENRAAAEATVTISDVTGPGGPLAYRHYDTNAIDFVWLPLPDPLTVALDAGSAYDLRLAVCREAFAAEVYETTLQIISDHGARYRVPLSATVSESR